MCGIFGIFSSNHPQYSYSHAVMRHRGPDNFGEWSDEYVYLAHHRLSIIDLSDAATQPMHDESGRYAMIYNGEVYNYQAIRDGLIQAGVSFSTQSDSEVVLQAYITYGADAFSMFSGMFAIAIYDKHTHGLIAARDRFGIKPLLYSVQDNGVAFASELRAFTRSGWCEGTLEDTALNGLFKYGSVQQPLTILKNVNALEPGNYLRISLSETGALNIQKQRYSSLYEDIESQRIDYKTAVKTLREKLDLLLKEKNEILSKEKNFKGEWFSHVAL